VTRLGRTALAIAGIVGAGCPDEAGRVVADARDSIEHELEPDDDAREPDDVRELEDGREDEASSDVLEDAVEEARSALPPWLGYCGGTRCDGLEALVIVVCPEVEPACAPTRMTTVVPSIDGRPIDAVAFPLGLPEGATMRILSGSGHVAGAIVTAYAPRIEVRSDLEVTVSYYEVPPAWGGTTSLDFESATRTSTIMDSVFFRHPSYDTGPAADLLHTRGLTTIGREREVTGVTSEKVRAFFMPTELAAVSGEGNFSYGDGTVTSNYGNPPYIAALGGIIPVAFPRFAHEVAHELFDEIRSAFLGDVTCLNEGLADALAWVVGDLPEADFGPVGVRGIDFSRGCLEVDEIHDVGNCYFWQVKQAGLLDAAFMRGIFDPRAGLDFDSCDQHARRTGDAILVYFTEAAGGADMVPVVDAMGLDHAGSYAAALGALGLPPAR